MVKITIRLTRSAAEKSHKIEDVRKAAAAAFEAAGRGEIHCLAFKANGQQFALSSRTILEVDWLPNRIPPGIIRGPGTVQVKRRRSGCP
ncbi:MAG: hypothetical protein F9K19_00490 [Rhizobiaceae bacterium]|nr:MAG: hypothetical protein F9K19_00490 [Rhizobiaceae bacterium]CAG0952940.1 hypothetical protein RHIZO_00288 [Rhizobiaceae bacterium]